MMKRLIVLSVVMLVVLATAASAAVDDVWVVGLRGVWAGQSTASINMGTKTGCSDVWRTTPDADSQLPNPSNGYLVVAGTLVALCGNDYREPMTTNPAGKVWNIEMYVQGQAEGASATFTLKGWGSGTNMLSEDLPSVKLKQGSTVLWTVEKNVSGSSTAPNFTKEFTLSDGAKTYLTLEAQVPEPGSIVAMMSGLVGLAGFVIRRKR